MKTKIGVILVIVVGVIFASVKLVDHFKYEGYITLEKEVYQFGVRVPENFYNKTLNTYSCSHSNTVGNAQAVTCRSIIDSTSISYIFYEDNWKLIGMSLVMLEDDFNTLKPKFSIEKGKEQFFSEIPFGIFYKNGFLYSKVMHDSWICLNLIKMNRKIDILELPPSRVAELYF